MYKPIILPYNIYSSSAKNLAHELNTKRVRLQGRYHPKTSHVVCNWGCSNIPHFLRFVLDRYVDRHGRPIPVLNPFSAVGVASNKLSTFEILQRENVSIPPFTTDIEEARTWAPKSAVVGRLLLRGSGGKGIVLKQQGEALEEVYDGKRVQLWVKYIKKVAEYRVHVFQNRVIATQEKRRKRGEDNNYQIRNYDNGYVFCREDVAPSEERDALAIQAVRALGLTFGGVDIIFNQKSNQFYVLEVNTAVGLEGQTVVDYANAIRGYCNGL